MVEEKKKVVSGFGIGVAAFIGFLMVVATFVMGADLVAADSVQLDHVSPVLATTVNAIPLAAAVAMAAIAIWVCFFRRRGLWIMLATGFGLLMATVTISSIITNTRVGRFIDDSGKALPTERISHEVGFPVWGGSNLYWYERGPGDREAKVRMAITELRAQAAEAPQTQPTTFAGT